MSQESQENTTTKATLYLDAKLYRALKMRAVETGASVSSLMNDALKLQLSDDLSDIESIRERLLANEKPLTYEAALKELQKQGSL